MKRLFFLDNLRWMTVLLVIVYHVFYIFNCSGVVSSINVQGIPVFDAFQMFVYPWFMVLMFIIAGVSANYALQKRSGKAFIKDRAIRILVPSITGMFAYGWIAGWIASQYAEDPEAFAQIPKAIQIMIIFLSGTGPLWFCQLLFPFCLVLMLIRKIDKHQKLTAWGEKASLPVLILMMIPFWISSMILNMPMITVFRIGIYFFSFMMGYCVFCHESVQERLEKVAVWLMIPVLLSGIVITALHYGENYADNAFLTNPLVNAYAWMMVLALFGIGRKYLNFQNKFTAFMTTRSQSYYLLHYTFVVSIAYLCVTRLTMLPFGVYYVLMFSGTALFLPLVTELLFRIPVLNTLLLGVTKKK